MTEQQIENLKNILSSTDELTNSKELDAKILKAAKLNVPAKKQFFDTFGFKHQSLSFISTAALSVLLTTGIIFSLSYVVTNDRILDEKRPVASNTTIEEREIDLLNTTPVQIKKQIDLFDKPITEPARAQILAGMQSSDIAVLLDEMSFAHLDERLLAERAITEAMQDIRFMVMDDQLNSARERYERLRRSCSVCTLPETLEALVSRDVFSSVRRDS